MQVHCVIIQFFLSYILNLLNSSQFSNIFLDFETSKQQNILMDLKKKTPLFLKEISTQNHYETI
jgi:hypothetical protein